MNKSHNGDRSRHIIKLWFVLVTILGAFMLVEWFSPYSFQTLSDTHLLREAEDRIQKIRKGTIEINLGSEWANRTIVIHQNSHAFLFGSNTYQYGYYDSALNQLYAENFAELFNSGTIRLYWQWFEPRLGEFPRYNEVKNITAWLASFNATMKGHNILWDSELVPDWISDQANQTEIALQRIEGLLTMFPEISMWDLFNEPIHHPPSWFGYDSVYAWKAALDRAKMIQPNGTFIINEYNTIGSGHPNWGSGTQKEFYQFIANVKAAGYAPDAIGFQFHSVDYQHPLQDIIDTFEAYGEFQIPCHITEFIPGSKGFYKGGTIRGPMSEQKQAEYAKNIYTMLFSHPAIDAIMWWDFADNAIAPAWQKELGAYMMTPTGRFLPVYEVLMDLIHSKWNSTQTIQLNGDGIAEISGFFGDYTIYFNNEPLTQFSITRESQSRDRFWTIKEMFNS